MTPYVPPDAHRPAVRRFIRPDWAPQADSLGDVRRRIDDIDHQMVSLLVQRALCVRDATRFKLDLHQVAAPERQAKVFARVRALAAAHEDQFPGLGDVADATADFRDQYYGLADAVVDEAVAAGRRAVAGEWGRTSVTERAQWLERIAAAGVTTLAGGAALFSRIRRSQRRPEPSPLPPSVPVEPKP